MRRGPRRRGGCGAAAAAAALLSHAGAAADATLPLKYLGCFQDQGNARDFSTDTLIDEDDMTVGSCLKHCSTAESGKPARYMALQDGNQCFCGNSYGKHGAIEQSRCGKKCKGGATPGETLDTCGGVFSNQVYELLPGAAARSAAGAAAAAGGGAAAATDVGSKIRALQKAGFDTKPLGCFADKSPGREYKEETLADSEEMTTAYCKKHCIDTGPFRYFVLQDGNQCFCGNNEPGKYGPSEKCTKDCRGGATPDNTGGKCGGVFANQVYELVPRQARSAAGPGAATGAGVCGVPGAVLVCACVVLFTGLGDRSFSCTLVLCSGGYGAGWVFAGSLLSRWFTVGLSALLGNIAPDSRALSPAGLRWAAAAAFVALGLFQVVRSFRTAGRDQSDRREEVRWAGTELGQKSLLLPGRQDLPVEEHTSGPSALSHAFTTCLLAEWGGSCQMSVAALALAVDVRSVIAGGLLAQFYCVSLAAVCSPASALTRNAAALKLNFAAGMALFFLAMHHIFEAPEAQ